MSSRDYQTICPRLNQLIFHINLLATEHVCARYFSVLAVATVTIIINTDTTSAATGLIRLRETRTTKFSLTEKLQVKLQQSALYNELFTASLNIAPN
jgi:hypothetical protein